MKDDDSFAISFNQEDNPADMLAGVKREVRMKQFMLVYSAVASMFNKGKRSRASSTKDFSLRSRQ